MIYYSDDNLYICNQNYVKNFLPDNEVIRYGNACITLLPPLLNISCKPMSAAKE